jgi:hypothetical protein
LSMGQLSLIDFSWSGDQAPNGPIMGQGIAALKRVRVL